MLRRSGFYHLLYRLGKYLFGEATFDRIMFWVGVVFFILLALYLLAGGVGVLMDFFAQKRRGQKPFISLSPRLSGHVSGPRLAALFLGVLLLYGGAVALFVFVNLPETPQEQAVAAIKKMKGEIVFDESSPDHAVVKVSFRDSPNVVRDLSDDNLASLRPHLEALPQLRELDLVRADQPLHGQPVSASTRLGVSRYGVPAYFVREDLTDSGLQHLRGLTQLHSLKLGSQCYPTRLTQAGIDELRTALPHTEVTFYQPGRNPQTSSGKH